MPGELDKVKEVSFSAGIKFIFDILTLMFSLSALLSNPLSLVSVSSACRKGSRELCNIVI